LHVALFQGPCRFTCKLFDEYEQSH
jgi:hypothetical protein